MPCEVKDFDRNEADLNQTESQKKLDAWLKEQNEKAAKELGINLLAGVLDDGTKRTIE